MKNERGRSGWIYWDPTLGLIDQEGGLHSPALVLIHELSHSRRAFKNFMKYIKDAKIDTDPAVWGEKDSKEEDNAIKETNDISNKANNGGAISRVTHRGKTKKVKFVLELPKNEPTKVALPIRRI